MIKNSQHFIRFRQAAVCFCLFAYLLAAGFIPTLLALGAWAEGSHAVTLGCAADRLSVVLHHERTRPATTHGPASTILCLLGTTTPGPLADHVASFTNPPACEKAAGDLKAKSVESLCKISFDWSGNFALPSPPSTASLTSTASEFLPLACLRSLRTTVLLV